MWGIGVGRPLLVYAASENARGVSPRRTTVTTRFSLLVVTVLATVLAGAPALAGTPEDTTGVVDQTKGIWYLRDASNGATTSFYYGNPGDYPMVGDWNCDGIDTPGLYRQSDGYVYLRNANTQGNAHIRFFFGNPGDIPLPGDFNKDGCDTVSIYRPSEARIYVINELGSNGGGLGAADYSFLFGNPGDKPFTGDFNNNGQDTVGLHRESTGFVYFRNTLTTGIADSYFFYGDPGDQIITGLWAQDPTKGPDTVGRCPSVEWPVLSQVREFAGQRKRRLRLRQREDDGRCRRFRCSARWFCAAALELHLGLARI